MLLGIFAEQNMVKLGIFHLQAFKESCQNFYEADLEELSFAEDTEECRKHINDWVKEKTEGERFSFQETWPNEGERTEIAWDVTSMDLPL